MNNTIFDDVFRTMIEKMPYLAVPLINEVFHTSYPENVKITQLRNEHQQEDGEIITDSCLLIGKKMYHIECQSTDDTTMTIRMIEYDFAIAIGNAEKQNRRYRIEFPKSCVLFLRSSENTPDNLEADVIFPDGRTHVYSIPTIKMADYTKDSIFEKNLLMLEYKLEERGKYLIKVDRYFASSKICSACGKKKEKLSLSERIYYCECGHRMDRDVNAEVNIMNEGKRIFAECA